jgi:hypothetical protein
LEENNYKLVITWFAIEEDKEWILSLNTLQWYLLIR